MIWLLKVSALLENVNLEAQQENTWILDIVSQSGDERREGVHISRREQHELEGSRGKANFIVRWPGERKQSYINVVDVKSVMGTLRQEQSEEFVAVAAFECRGLQPVVWHPSTDFIAESIGGRGFGVVDLQEGDWADYDEDNSVPVSVTELQHKFEPAG